MSLLSYTACLEYNMTVTGN